ncbi:MAG TPA: hypothetical protein VH394_09730 [Thermoanaerobaculia bacterium]|jgi:hypothetical protein|nr:hypothetical protein [Thermoanaerobaculia bacterium]
MKTDRFSPVLAWTAAVLLVVLVLAAGRPAASQTFTYRFDSTPAPEAPSKRLAQELAGQIEKVRKAFAAKRLKLHTVTGKAGAQGYPVDEVSSLVTYTREDVDQAIAAVGEPGLQALRAWSAKEMRSVQNELPAASSIIFSSLSTPRAIAVIASLEAPPLPRLAAAPKPETISAEKADALLDRVGAVIERIFYLASHDDLEVTLWVGSTPPTGIQFSFWAQGRVKEDSTAPIIIRTNGTKSHVLRGEYEYNATWTDGAVTDRIRYPSPAGVQGATASERLDLVNGNGFFCCRFNEHYCHHVESPKECR